MDSRFAKSFSGRVPAKAGESRTVSEDPSETVCPMYTEGGNKAMEGEVAASAVREEGGAITRERLSSVLLTAPGTDLTETENDDQRLTEGLVGGQRVATPVPARSKFFRTVEDTSDDYGSGRESTLSRNREEAKIDEKSERLRRSLRKRRVSLSPEETDKGPATMKTSSKRGRGRPPTTSRTKTTQDVRREKQLALEAEKEITDPMRRIPPRRSHRRSESSLLSDVSMVDDEECTAGEWNAVIMESLSAISRVAKKNLKGSSIAALNKATRAIEKACEALLNRTSSTETKALEVANARLSKDLADMRTELETVKSRLAEAQPYTAPINKERNMEELLQQAMREAISVTNARMDARLESLEARLLPEPCLRPPLTSDRKKKEEVSPASTLAKQTQKGTKKGTRSAEPSVTTLMPPTNSGPAPKNIKKKKSAAAAEAEAARKSAATSSAVSKPAPATAVTPESEWTNVVKKKGKVIQEQKGNEKKTGQRRKQGERGRRKLRVPKTAAVVLTLQPGAAEKGVTYKDILGQAKRDVNLTALEIPAVRFKVAVTGARMLEIRGTDCQKKADALASKIKDVLGEDNVRVARPQRCAELRIIGLDDSATSDEIAEAIAKPGNCAPADIKVGQIRRERGGCGSAWVKCPIEAAKRVTTPGVKVYVGWMVVRVVLLSVRPMRCFKCQETGHTSATCSSQVDRSSACFRCGQPDHSAVHCNNAPHCALCAEKGKPANHTVGSKACNKAAAKEKGYGMSRVLRKFAPPATAVASTAREVPMEAS